MDDTSIYRTTVLIPEPSEFSVRSKFRMIVELVTGKSRLNAWVDDVSYGQLLNAIRKLSLEHF